MDDLALTLLYTNERLGHFGAATGQLRTPVDAYDGFLEPRMSALERQALPYAVARTPSRFAAQVVASRGPAWSWASSLIDDPDWTTAFS